jgi:hypothetical protein
MWRTLCGGTITAAACAVIVSGGCVERRETIRIEPDGRVAIELEYRSDSAEDLYEGDAVPRPGDRLWLVDQRIERDDEGKERHILKAQAFFAPRQQLPETYTDARNPAGAALQFPTTVRFERRRDGTYVHFRRVYQKRVWAAMEGEDTEDRLRRNDGGRPAHPQPTNHDERVALVREGLEQHVRRWRGLARAAFLEATPDGAQDAWLAAHEAIGASVSEMAIDRLARLLDPAAETEDRTPVLRDELAALEKAMLRQIEDALGQSGAYGPSKVNAFITAFQARRAAHDVTNDLNDDGFEITLEMPGPIIGSNAESVSGRTAVFKFAGCDLHDRDIELLATARLPE